MSCDAKLRRCVKDLERILDSVRLPSELVGFDEIGLARASLLQALADRREAQSQGKDR